ncbi:MAG: bifunctional glutamate N-acetyltransferase/amino-acid acetyltransferase ArgJ [Pseudomonadota bacterium]
MGKADTRSPLAPSTFPDLPEIAGAAFATAQSEIRYKGRKDVMLATLCPGTVMAGVFTKSATRSAAVVDCQEKLGQGSEAGAAILVNSGNANAFTGHAGKAAVSTLCQATAECLNLPDSRVFTSSTGVIGERLPHEKITSHLEDMAARTTPAGLTAAAEAIMTTDTFPKGSGRKVDVAGKTVHIAGIAKGSGMIAPDMATMLVYIFTDALVSKDIWQDMISALNAKTFNCITVDSDTSTSDTLLAAATGASGIEVTEENLGFMEALHTVMIDLAHQVVRDGEGASKFVEVSVSGALSDADAKTHAMAIANSPLVKTALAGEDPNWGRVVMAVGKSGASADRDALSIWFGDLLVAEKGWVSPSYREEAAAAYMKKQEIEIRVDLGIGGGTAVVWTCDLTHGYISINADYRS